MTRSQGKVSGGRHTLTGARRRLLMPASLSTARKHGPSPLTVLRDLFTGNPWLPPAHASSTT